jgi:hypothetical protein
VSILGDIGSNGPDFDIVTARNGDQQTTMKIQNPSPGATVRKYYNIVYKASFTQNKFARALGPFNQVGGGAATIASHNGNTFISFRTGTSTDQVMYNGQLILPESSPFQSGILSIDKDGNFREKKDFSKVADRFAHSFLLVGTKVVDNFVYVIGTQADNLKYGALLIKHKGEGDGLVLKMDTSLNLVQFYSVASNYSDLCSDIDVYSDLSLTIAHRSQGTPAISIGPGQMSTLNTTTSISPTDLEESGFVTQSSGLLLPPDYIFTIKNGSWHDAATWNTGKIPKETDRVLIRHKVQILEPAVCFQLFLDPTADLFLMNGINLRITGGPPE